MINLISKTFTAHRGGCEAQFGEVFLNLKPPTMYIGLGLLNDCSLTRFAPSNSLACSFPFHTTLSTCITFETLPSKYDCETN